ncbi:MAG: pro-sigmaK processing inhibitor BofA family protein [Bacilli bacterium]|nr:pro-sigmaK processing inhibitor BofA family protein [Bacilli bacterium]
MKKIFNLFKKIVFAFFLLYGFNMLYGTFNINIPINVYTILFTTFLGFPGFCAIILISKLLF